MKIEAGYLINRPRFDRGAGRYDGRRVLNGRQTSYDVMKRTLGLGCVVGGVFDLRLLARPVKGRSFVGSFAKRPPCQRIDVDPRRRSGTTVHDAGLRT